MKTKSIVELILILVLLVGSPLVFLARAQIPIAGIDLTKVASETHVLSGTSVSYLYNVTNTGTTLLTGNITDNVYGTIGYFTDLQPDHWVAFNVTHVINCTMTNIATAMAEDQFGTPVSDSATATVIVLLEGPHLTLTKVASDDFVFAVTSVSYLYNVTNTGSTSLTGDIVDDLFGSVGSFVDLQPGGWVAFNVTHVINATTTNVATANAIDQSGAPATDSATATVRVLLEGPHIEVTKICEPCAQPAPGTVTWKVTVTNIGTVTLNAVNVTDSIHGYLGSTGTLDPGQGVFFVIVETGLQPDVYTDTATAYGWYQAGDTVVSDSDTAECVVCPEFVVPEVPFGVITVLSSMIFAVATVFGVTKLRRKGDSIKP